MTEWINSVDTWLFYAINKGWSNPIGDVIFPFITAVKHWYAVYVAALLYAVFRAGWKGKVCALLLCIGVAIADPLASRVIKERVQRPRPYVTLAEVRTPAGASGGFSFPSAHATNNFMAAFVCSYFFRKQQALWYAIAMCIALSRVYCGVHYPLDVVGGALVGTVVAAALIGVFVFAKRRSVWLQGVCA